MNQDAWPDSFDTAVTLAFFATALLLPALGYFFMVADFRAYLRSLRRQLVRVVSLGGEAPWWAYRESPRCLTVFGLALPCSEEELLRAYRERVKQLHPDRGGDKRRFLKLQASFEEAMRVVREHAPLGRDAKPPANPRN